LPAAALLYFVMDVCEA